MGINFYFSNKIEDILDKLSKNIYTENKTLDPFYSPEIIIPNPNLKKWIEIKTAETYGIAINIKFSYLENSLWELINELTENKFNINNLNKEHIQLLILGILINSNNENKNISPIINYLNTNDQTSNDFAHKTWQLSERIADLFREYEYHRPDMINIWLKDSISLKDDKLEIAEQYIYNKLFKEFGIRDSTNDKHGEKKLTLPQFFNFVKSKINKKLNKILHIFCFSQLSIFHINLLKFLSNYLEINMYQLNYHDEFWKTIEENDLFNWSKAAIIDLNKNQIVKQETLEIINNKREIFQQWAKVGRDAVYLFCNDISKTSSINISSNNIFNIKSILGNLQNYITKTNFLIKEKIPQDTSLQVIGCPSKYREVETVYNSIIHNMKNDNNLKLTDIAILVPNMDRYNTAIKSVFTQNPQHKIPYNLSDVSAASSSIIGQALISLLNLVESSFTRKDVFDLLLNPAFYENFNLIRDDIMIWLKWANTLDVFHGYVNNTNSKNKHHDIFFTWTQALIRLRLGKIMDTENENLEEFKFLNFNGIVPYSDIDSRDSNLLSQFSFVIELLINNFSEIKDKKYSPKKWIDIINNLVTTFLTVPKDFPEEQKIQIKLLHEIKKLEYLDSALNLLNKNKEITLPYIIEFIKSILSSIKIKKGNYLTGGVTISSLMPMRPIPFKIIYIIGIGENEFPGRNNLSTLDLRNRFKRLNDANINDINKLLFLETILSAREKIYISYVSRDLQKDEILYPSSLIQQLIKFIEDNILKDKFKIFNDIPISSNNPMYFNRGKEFDETNSNRITDVLYNYSLQDNLLNFVELSKLDYSNKKLNDILNQHKDKIDTSTKFIIDTNERKNSEIEKITISNLKEFILNPVEATLKKFLRIRGEDDEDLTLRDTEPFCTQYPVDYKLITTILNSEIKSIYMNKSFNPENFKNKFHAYYNHMQLKSMTPIKEFAIVDDLSICEELNDRIIGDKHIDGIYNFLKSKIINKFYSNIIIGENNTSLASSIKLNPIHFDLNLSNGTKQAVELHGQLQFLLLCEESTETIILTNSKKPSIEISRHLIEPFLFYLTVLSDPNNQLAEFFTNRPFCIHLLYKDRIMSYKYQISKEKAFGYINKLISDFTQKDSFDYLPFEIIINNNISIKPYSKSNFEDNDRIKYAKLLKEIIEEDKDNMYTKVKSMQVLSLIKPHVPLNAFEIIKERYTLLMDYE